MAAVTKFLSKENFEYVLQVTRQYLRESHGISVPDAAFQQVIAGEMKRIHGTTAPGSAPALDTLNKLAIVAVRDHYTAVSKQAQHAQQPPPPPPKPQPAPPPPEDDDVAKQPEENAEEVLMMKVRELEIQRTSLAPVQLAAMSAIAGAEEPVAVGPPPPPMAPSTIIVNNNNTQSSRQGKVVVINSFDRMWMYECPRSTFVYSDNINSAGGALDVLCVCVPRPHVLCSYILLNIEGAGGTTFSVVLVPDAQFGGAEWCYYRPLNDGGMPNISVPWTIRLCDPYAQPLHLGHDGWVIGTTIRTQRNTSVCELTNMHVDTVDLLSEFTAGDVIRITYPVTNTSKDIRVVHVTKATLEVAASDVTEGGVILNLYKQSSVFIHVAAKNETAKRTLSQ